MPEIGDKFKCARVPRRTFSFVGEKNQGSVTWWDFYDIEDGKYHAFYPDEVVPLEQYRRHPKHVEVERPYIGGERQEQTITVAGEEIVIR